MVKLVSSRLYSSCLVSRQGERVCNSRYPNLEYTGASLIYSNGLILYLPLSAVSILSRCLTSLWLYLICLSTVPSSQFIYTHRCIIERIVFYSLISSYEKLTRACMSYGDLTVCPILSAPCLTGTVHIC